MIDRDFDDARESFLVTQRQRTGGLLKRSLTEYRTRLKDGRIGVLQIIKHPLLQTREEIP